MNSKRTPPDGSLPMTAVYLAPGSMESPHPLTFGVERRRSLTPSKKAKEKGHEDQSNKVEKITNAPFLHAISSPVFIFNKQNEKRILRKDHLRHTRSPVTVDSHPYDQSHKPYFFFFFFFFIISAFRTHYTPG